MVGGVAFLTVPSFRDGGLRMYTSILVVALSGFAPAADTAVAPSWMTDYTKAGQLSAREHKPLAVFLGSGKDGYLKLSQDGSLSREAKQILAEKYVCLHIDTSTEHGQSLADAFEMPDGLGIVISDRTSKLQAFRHEGDLTEDTLVRYLVRYSDPQLVVRGTDTNPSHETRRSYYAPPEYTGGWGFRSSGFSCRGGH
jgi:hypothetical protein